MASGLTESIPSRSKNAVGPFSCSIAKRLVNKTEQYCLLIPTFSLLSKAKIFRMSFPDMLCPPMA